MKLYKVYPVGAKQHARLIAASTSWEARKSYATLVPGTPVTELVAVAQQEEEVQKQ